MSPVIVGTIDLAMLSLWAFTLFFIGLVVYLNQESRREGYPLGDEETGRLFPASLLDFSRPKTFHLPHGQGVTHAPPRTPREPVSLAGRKAFGGPGAPLVPTGNPLVDGIGPAAWTPRADRADLDLEGHPRIVPLSTLEALSVDRRDTDPRGLPVLGCDGRQAGTVRELWVDRADRLVRYLEVSIPSGRDVLLPFTMVLVKRDHVVTDSVTAAQFADAPATARPDQVTLREEDRIVGYFGGGYLYATPARQEPLL